MTDEGNTDPSQQDDTILRLVELEPVRDLERLNALVMYFNTGWCNPFIASTKLIRDPRFRELLKKRLRGETRVPGALASALGGLIVGFN